MMFLMYIDTNYAVFFAHSKKPEEHRKDERARKVRRYITGCKMLFLISVMSVLSGCGDGADEDLDKITESAETMEAVEDWWYEYFGEGSQMTEAEYEECLNKLIDTSKCVEPAELYTKDEMLEILAE